MNPLDRVGPTLPPNPLRRTEDRRKPGRDSREQPEHDTRQDRPAGPAADDDRIIDDFA